MKRRRALLFTFFIVLALSVACGWWLHRERRQYALNRQLIAALEQNDTQTALALVNAGADPNTRFEPMPAPTLPQLLKQLLHHTPPPVNDSPTAFLMACGAKWTIETPRRNERTTQDENLPLVQTMLAHGANMNARASEKHSALHEAIKVERLHTVELLLQHGIDVNAQSTYGVTPLMMAESNSTMNIAGLLLSHAADPNVQDEDGNTALYFAFSWIHEKSILPELLAHGANPNLRNKNGQSPLQYARQNKRSDLVRLLTRDAK